MTAPSGVPERVGRYPILEVIGRGAMGVVYRAVDPDTGVPLALKTVVRAGALPLGSLRREIRALSRLRHPGLVHIRDEGVHDGVPWYAMELVPGESLRSLMRRRAAAGAVDAHAPTLPVTDAAAAPTLALTIPLDRGALPPPATAAPPRGPAEDPAPLLRIVQRLCGALAYLHGEGIVHRDLKPDNVMVRPDGRPVILDLGLVARFGGGVSREALEVGGDLVGTAWYMAPEQVRGELVDARADLYAVGCMLYEIVTGAPPFVGGSPLEILAQHLRAAPTPPSAVVPAIPPRLDALVLGLLAKDPRDRLGHALDLAEALHAVTGERGEPDGPRPRSYLYRPRLAGRDEALGRLRATLSALAPGRGALLTLAGESGVGKTRLAMELATHAREQGHLVLGGEGGAGSAEPLGALRGALQAVADRCREGGAGESRSLLGPRARILAPYEPALQSLPGLEEIPDVEDLPADAARLRVLSTLADTLGELSRRVPILLLVDDVQDADDLTQELLGLLHRGGQLAATAMVVLAIYRSDDLPERLSWIRSVPEERSVRLHRLGAPEVAAVASDMLAMPSPPASLVGFLGLVSEGNPFFLAEYLRTLVAESILTRDEGGIWRVRGAAAELDLLEATLPMPGTLRDLLHRRLASVSPAARPVLHAAAVLGAEADDDLVAAVSGLDADTAGAMVRDLVSRAVLEERRGRLRFGHQRLEAAAYARLDPATRVELHRRAAGSLAARPDRERLQGEIGRHHHRAGELDPARACYLLGARRARAAHALAEAERLLTSYLELALPGPERLAARMEMGDGVLRIAGRNVDAIAQLTAALHEALALGDLAAASDASRSLGFLHRLTGDMESAESCYAEALRLAARLGDERLRGLLLSELAVLRHHRGQVGEAEALCREALAIHRRRGDRHAEGLALTNLASIVHDLGRAGESEELHLAAAGIFREDGDRHQLAVALGGLAHVVKDDGRIDEARAIYEEVLRIGRETGDVRYQGVAVASLASLDYDLHNVPEALASYTDALELFRRVGDRRSEGVALSNIGQLHYLAGRIDEGERTLRQALQIHQQIGNRRSEASSLRLLADIAYLRGRLDEARTLHHEALGIARELRHHRQVMLSLLALTHVEREGHGDLDTADALAAEAASSCTPRENLSDLTDLACQLGLNALARGRDASPHLTRARELAGRAGRVLDVMARAHLDLLERSVVSFREGRPLEHGQADRPDVLR